MSQMLVVDTSAVISVFLMEEGHEELIAALTNNILFMSAGTLAELAIVADSRDLGGILDEFLKGLNVTIVEVTRDLAEDCRKCYARWGKGRHAAKLNFGDTFAYALAKHLDCALLFIGEDFSKTDVKIYQHVAGT